MEKVLLYKFYETIQLEQRKTGFLALKAIKMKQDLNIIKNAQLFNMKKTKEIVLQYRNFLYKIISVSAGLVKVQKQKKFFHSFLPFLNFFI